MSPELARRMRALDARIAAGSVPKSSSDAIKIATWNIRELGRRPRRVDSLHFIARVIAQFDLVAIVELRENLADFETIMRLLGPTWRALFTAPVFDAGGNRERATYLFDTRIVEHSGLASGVQAPRTKRGSEYLSKIGWWRAPFLASFRAGDAELLLLTAHLRWARDDAGSLLRELQLLADWIDTELVKDPFERDRELVVLGDFNLPATKGPLFEAITSHGLRVPDALLGEHGTNLARNKRYDQILVRPSGADAFTQHAGALDFYSGGIAALYPARSGIDALRFTFEMSDHLPLWAQVRTRRRVGPGDERRR